jgi:hypothetical protein
MRLKAIVIGFFAMGVAVSAAHAKPTTECTMKYNLKGWSAFYKKADGTGTIRCNNGQKASVRLATRGGGLTAGKTEIRDGLGYFSPVSSIDELFGRYDTASAGAAAGKAASAQALVKDNIRLSLTGTGKGVELGVALGKFTISKR